jgi:hypothetical protein
VTRVVATRAECAGGDEKISPLAARGTAALAD